MSDAELDALEAILSSPPATADQVRDALQSAGWAWEAVGPTATLYGAVGPLVREVRRLRDICAAALPVMETAIRAGLDNFSTAEEDEIIAGHGTIKALRAALAPPADQS